MPKEICIYSGLVAFKVQDGSIYTYTVYCLAYEISHFTAFIDAFVFVFVFNNMSTYGNVYSAVNMKKKALAVRNCVQQAKTLMVLFTILLLSLSMISYAFTVFVT